MNIDKNAETGYKTYYSVDGSTKLRSILNLRIEI